MGRKATQYVVLGVVVVILVVVVVYQWGGSAPAPDALGAAVPTAAPSPPPREVSGRRGASAPLEVPDVKLGALRVSPPEPQGLVRSPFRLVPPPLPPPPAAAMRPAASADNPDQPSLPPPPPPITLRFIGLVNAGGGVGKIAVLTSGSDVFYGREGDIIDGRYKIINVGTESVVVAYADGRGSRRIPLSGS